MSSSPTLTASRDTRSWEAWWRGLPASVLEDIRDSLDGLGSDAAGTLKWLMLYLFQEPGHVAPLAVAGLPSGATCVHAWLDVDPRLEDAAADVVLSLGVAAQGRTVRRQFTAYVDDPHRDLVPESVADPRAAVDWVVDRALELVNAEMAGQAEFWSSLR